MATSTFLSLVYVPVAYTYFDSLGALFGRLAAFRPRPPAPTSRPSMPLPVAGGASVAAERVQAARGRSRRLRGGAGEACLSPVAGQPG
jgi:hypothetical protein